MCVAWDTCQLNTVHIFSALLCALIIVIYKHLYVCNPSFKITWTQEERRLRFLSFRLVAISSSPIVASIDAFVRAFVSKRRREVKVAVNLLKYLSFQVVMQTLLAHNFSTDKSVLSSYCACHNRIYAKPSTYEKKKRSKFYARQRCTIVYRDAPDNVRLRCVNLINIIKSLLEQPTHLSIQLLTQTGRNRYRSKRIWCIWRNFGISRGPKE